MLRAILLSLAAIVTFSASFSQAVPAHIIILRHGEKINDSDRDLSPQGFQRAQALAIAFQRPAFVSRYGKPRVFYAANPQTNNSRRSVETIKPSADALNVPINSSFDKDDGKELMISILADGTLDGTTVVICWNHAGIKDLLKPLSGNFQRKWSGKVFDRFWILDPNNSGGWDLEDVPQNLLPEDDGN